jgi:hypothetical protein
MRAFRTLPTLALVAVATLGGCAASWNDRYTSNWDSALNLFQLDTPSRAMWPTSYPQTLPPLTTPTIPVRPPEPGVPQPGWPPLSPALDADGAIQAPGCGADCDSVPRATVADAPDSAVRGDVALSR